MVQYSKLIFEGVQFVMEGATFVQFIQEEAIQACQLGTFLAFRQRNYKAVSLGYETLSTVLLPHLKAANEGIGWLAPYSKGAFEDFIVSTETSLAIYQELLFGMLK